MNIKEIIICLILPLLGVIFYIFLATKIKKDKARKSLLLEFFLIFANYGALIITVLTFYLLNLFGLAIMVYAYLMTIAPVIMAIIAYRHRKNREENRFYKYAYCSAVAYFVFLPIACLLIGFS